MQLHGLKVGDTIGCNVKGRRFHAKVAAVPSNGSVAIEPPRGITYYHVTARQVTERPPRWDPMQAVRCRAA